MCFCQIWKEADNDQIRIREQIYVIADSEQKWSGLGAETKLIGLVRLKVVNNHTTNNIKNKNDNMLK
jgi:hypothetical protein